MGEWSDRPLKIFYWKFPWGQAAGSPNINDHPHKLYFIFGVVNINVGVISGRATGPVAPTIHSYKTNH